MSNLREKVDEKLMHEKEKMRIVKRYYCEKIHGHALAREEGISATALGEWVHRYLHHIKEEVADEKRKLAELIEPELV